MISIIVPAHNEQSVIGRCISALLDGQAVGELEVIVACNGCSDQTAAIARAFGEPVKVIEIPDTSKTAALNAADAVASGYPRLYVDADVVLPLTSVRMLSAALSSEGARFACPVACTDTTKSSAAVRAFYAIWLRLPYNRVGVGTGVYALSQKGRAVFESFPPIIADDAYVRSRFAPHERIAIQEAPVTVYAPRTFSDLLRVKTRSRLGGYQLRELYSRNDNRDRKRPEAVIGSLPLSMKLPYQLCVYVTVNVITRVRARRWLNSSHDYHWEKDESSRQ